MCILGLKGLREKVVTLEICVSNRYFLEQHSQEIK